VRAVLKGGCSSCTSLRVALPSHPPTVFVFSFPPISISLGCVLCWSTRTRQGCDPSLIPCPPWHPAEGFMNYYNSFPPVPLLYLTIRVFDWTSSLHFFVLVLSFHDCPLPYQSSCLPTPSVSLDVRYPPGQSHNSPRPFTLHDQPTLEFSPIPRHTFPLWLLAPAISVVSPPTVLMRPGSCPSCAS